MNHDDRSGFILFPVVPFKLILMSILGPGGASNILQPGSSSSSYPGARG
jgi:hypothetical protein